MGRRGLTRWRNAVPAFVGALALIAGAAGNHIVETDARTGLDGRRIGLGERLGEGKTRVYDAGGVLVREYHPRCGGYSDVRNCEQLPAAYDGAKSSVSSWRENKRRVYDPKTGKEVGVIEYADRCRERLATSGNWRLQEYPDCAVGNDAMHVFTPYAGEDLCRLRLDPGCMCDGLERSLLGWKDLSRQRPLGVRLKEGDTLWGLAAAAYGPAQAHARSSRWAQESAAMGLMGPNSELSSLPIGRPVATFSSIEEACAIERSYPGRSITLNSALAERSR